MPAIEKLWLSMPIRRGSGVHAEEFLAIFQAAIRDEKIPGLPIDAADYTHVSRGPRMLLVGFDEHYVIEGSDDRMSLVYQRKTPMSGTNGERIATGMTALVRVASLCAREPSMAGRLEFNSGDITMRIADRLRFENSPATFAALRDDLETAFAGIFRRNIALSHDGGNAKELFAVRVTTLSPVLLSELVSSLSA